MVQRLLIIITHYPQPEPNPGKTEPSVSRNAPAYWMYGSNVDVEELGLSWNGQTAVIASLMYGMTCPPPVSIHSWAKKGRRRFFFSHTHVHIGWYLIRFMYVEEDYSKHDIYRDDAPTPHETTSISTSASDSSSSSASSSTQGSCTLTTHIEILSLRTFLTASSWRSTISRITFGAPS